MRKLITRDVPAFARVLTEAGIRAEVRAMAERVKESGGTLKAEDVGWEIILAALEKLSGKRSEALMYEALSGPLEIGPEEIANMDLDVFGETLAKWYREYTNPETVRHFFGQLSRLMGQGSSMT